MFIRDLLEIFQIYSLQRRFVNFPMQAIHFLPSLVISGDLLFSKMLQLIKWLPFTSSFIANMCLIVEK